MQVIDKTFKVKGLESTLIGGKHTRCYRVYANMVSVQVKGFVCIFTDSSGEMVVDMGVNSCLQINAVNMDTHEHVPVFKAPINVGIFTVCNHLLLDIADQDECVWLHEFNTVLNAPLEFVFHLEIPEYWVKRNEHLKFRLKLT